MEVFTVVLFFQSVALVIVSLLIGQLALWDFSHVRHRITGRHTGCKLTDVSSGRGWGHCLSPMGAGGVVAACFLVTGISCEVRP